MIKYLQVYESANVSTQILSAYAEIPEIKIYVSSHVFGFFRKTVENLENCVNPVPSSKYFNILYRKNQSIFTTLKSVFRDLNTTVRYTQNILLC